MNSMQMFYWSVYTISVIIFLLCLEIMRQSSQDCYQHKNSSTNTLKKLGEEHFCVEQVLQI